MADVSTWSPIDESNTSPPPDGWPEFMMPSAVNNCARAMMGAVRRMYDDQLDGTLVLPYLSTSGGTLTGVANFNAGLTTTTINATGNVAIAGALNVSGVITAAGAINCGGPYQLQGASLASRSGNDTYFYDDTSQWTILTRSTGNTYYANTAHYFTSRNAAATYASITSSEANFSVPIKSSSTVESDRADAFAFYAPNGGATLAFDLNCRHVVASGNISVAGTLGVVTISASGTVTAANLTASGTVTAANLTATSTVSGGYVNSTGGINAAGQYTGGSVNVSGEVRGGSLATAGVLSVGGGATVGAVLAAHDVMPSADNVSICGGSTAAWLWVEAYTYITKGAAARDALGPLPDTLALVAAIEPQRGGFVAEDVQAAIGDLPVDIVRGEEGRLGLDYAGLTAVLWRAVQSLALKVQQLEGSHV